MMSPTCISIKVAVSLNKVADLSKEHSALWTPSFTFSSFFSGFRAVCGLDLFTLRAGTGRWRPNRELIGLHGRSLRKREYKGDPKGNVSTDFFRAERVFSREYKLWVKVVVENFL